MVFVVVFVCEILICVMVNGVVCVGFLGKIGRFVLGMVVDLIMICIDGVDFYFFNNVFGIVVVVVDWSNVDIVIIGGVVRKYGGKMINIDMFLICKMVEEL